MIDCPLSLSLSQSLALLTFVSFHVQYNSSERCANLGAALLDLVQNPTTPISLSVSLLLRFHLLLHVFDANSLTDEEATGIYS